jgi:RNA polymerase sigma-B factor
VSPHTLEREKTITEYHYLCARGARKFMREGIDRHDLEQVAAIGLIKAADRFDPTNGTPFEAYAWTLVLGELMHYVRDSERMVRAPRRLRDLERRCAAAERELRHERGREFTDEELMERLSISAAELTDIRRFRDERAPVSVEGLRPREQLSLSYTMDRQLDRLVIDTYLARLSPLERTIIQEIYENDTPIGDIARHLGYSRRHITRLHSAALRKLVART